MPVRYGVSFPGHAVAQRATLAPLLTGLNISMVEKSFNWSTVEATEDVYTWSSEDSPIDWFATLGLPVVLQFPSVTPGEPSWLAAHGDIAGEIQEIATLVCDRYAGKLGAVKYGNERNVGWGTKEDWVTRANAFYAGVQASTDPVPVFLNSATRSAMLQVGLELGFASSYTLDGGSVSRNEPNFTWWKHIGENANYDFFDLHLYFDPVVTHWADCVKAMRACTEKPWVCTEWGGPWRLTGTDTFDEDEQVEMYLRQQEFFGDNDCKMALHFHLGQDLDDPADEGGNKFGFVGVVDKTTFLPLKSYYVLQR